jgi:hypothetical protein
MKNDYQDPGLPDSAAGFGIQDAVRCPPQPDRMTSTQFFAVTAWLEVGAGLVLIVAPALAIRLLFGTFEIQTGVAIGRLAGAALVSLGAASWCARHDGGSAASKGLVSGLLIYNAAVVVLVLSGSFGSLGPPLWAVAIVHAAMAIWCVWLLRAGRA